MYVWNLSALRGDLKANSLLQREQFAYLVASGLFGWAQAQSPFAGPFGWNFLVGGVRLAIAGLAIYYVYICNGGRSGERFLERYLSLSWVLSVRFTILIEFPLLAVRRLYFDIDPNGATFELSTEIGIMTALQLFYYWLLGNQFRQVCRPAT